MNRYRAHVEAEIDSFIAACLVPDPGGQLPARVAYETYCDWYEAQPVEGFPIPCMEETMFGRLMPERVLRRRTSAGQVYLGVAVGSFADRADGDDLRRL